MKEHKYDKNNLTSKIFEHASIMMHYQLSLFIICQEHTGSIEHMFFVNIFL